MFSEISAHPLCRFVGRGDSCISVVTLFFSHSANGQDNLMQHNYYTFYTIQLLGFMCLLFLDQKSIEKTQYPTLEMM